VPVTADSFLWEATGFYTSGASLVINHPDGGGTTAGSTVLIVFAKSATSSITGPSGFQRVTGASNTQVFLKANVGAGETSWTFTMPAVLATWYLLELSSDVAAVDPVDESGSGTASIGNGGTVTTGSAVNVGSSGVALGFFGISKVADTDVQSWSSYTNSFVERLDVSPTSGNLGRTLGVAWRTYDTWSTWNSTATLATTGASATAHAFVLLLRSADASINAPLSYCTTFGFGTHAGMGASISGTAATAVSPLAMGSSYVAASQALGALPVGTWGTHYSVGAFGRDGRTGLEIATTAATASVRMPGSPQFVVGLNVNAVSGSGTPEVLRFESTADDLVLLYDVTNEKFGLKWSSGSPEWQTGTTPTGTFAWVDIRARVNLDIWHADWSIETGTGDGTQTSPTDLTGQTSLNMQLHLGGTGSQTGTFRYSDVVLSTYPAAYPLGPHIVRVLAPETTGATVSGTSSNFSKFTANGTLAAWAGDAGALLDDIPPTISASSDGAVQTAVAASDYMNFPMTTYTLAADEVIAGVRAFASLWGGTGSGTGTLGMRGWDGTTEASFEEPGTSFDPDSLTTASATYPMWYSGMWGVGTRWTQALLNAAALRVGFSTDATPDMGVSCVGLEVATKTITPQRLAAVGENDEFTVEAYVHPYNSAMIALTVNNDDPTLTAEMTYSVSGTPQTPITVTPGNSTTVDIHADSFGDISDVKLTAV
jgi:hypothetical protein